MTDQDKPNADPGASDRGPRRTAIEGDLIACWFCGRSLSPRALFCHACGSVQVPSPLDPFTRLGLARRFDLDPAELERQTVGFRRVLDPARFEARGVRERGIAQRQRDALQEAHDRLHDPLARARLLLDLAGIAPTAADDGAGLDAELEAAVGPVELDRIGTRIARDREAALRDLAAAFRAEDLTRAARLVAWIERLEAAGEAARAKRNRLDSGAPPP